MIIPFDPKSTPIVIGGFVTGPLRTGGVQLALDTGAMGTLIRPTVLASLGILVPSTARRRRLRSATGGATAPVFNIRQLLVLGHTRTDFPVIVHDLPPVVPYDGLLGLDFFRGLVLTLDFARGRASLGPPRKWWQVWR